MESTRKLVSSLASVISPNDAFETFFDWYQDVWLYEADLWLGLDKLERPLRELVVAHQVWGLISSDAFNSYYSRFDAKFDSEALMGYSLIGQKSAGEALVNGRNKFLSANNNEMTIKEQIELSEEFLKPLEKIEEQIGSFLLKNFCK